jgi:drug/metabolite transporter (DMT)-like permease
MATALALMAAGIFALSTVLQQRGGLKAPPLSVRHPGSFLQLAGQGTWLIGMALLIPGWILQAMALDRGRVAVIQPIFTMTIVFVLPLGWWLTAQTVTAKQVLEACVVVLGLSVFIIVGDPAGGRTDAPNWEWLAAIAVIAVLCAVLLPLGGKDRPSLRAGAYGTVAGVLSGLAATLTKPTVELLHTGGVGGVLGNWMVYVLVVAGLLGVLLQQIALQTARLAPAVATGSVANPLVGVLLGILLLEERLAPPTWHKVVAFVALGCALAAAVAISLSEERQSGRSREKRPAGEGDADQAGRLRPARDAAA